MADCVVNDSADTLPPLGRRVIDSIRTDPRIDIVIAAFIAQRLGWTLDEPVRQVMPLVLDSIAEGTYVIGAQRLLERLDALAFRDLVSKNGEDAMLAVRARLDQRVRELTYERDRYRNAWQAHRDHVAGEKAVPACQVVAIDMTTDHTLGASVAEMDGGVRQGLLSALRKAESADNEADIVQTVRDVLRETMPDETVVGVRFSAMEWDNGYFLHDIGTVLFADGTTTEIEFHLDEVFTDEYECVGERCTLAVDLRNGTVDRADTDWHSIHERFNLTA